MGYLCEWCGHKEVNYVDVEYYADFDENDNPVWFVYAIYRCDYCGLGDDFLLRIEPREVIPEGEKDDSTRIVNLG